MFNSSVDILEQIDCSPKISSERYFFQGKNVPRVTEILSSMMHEDYLLKWANGLGYKRKSYVKEVQYAADVGSFVHDNIEKFLKGETITLDEVPEGMRGLVRNGFESFIKWYKYMTSTYKVEVIGLEEKLVNQWYGGTYDMLVKINGLVYLVDFKTSNHVSYKYYIQTSVYARMLQSQGIEINGIIILQLNKYEVKYTEYFLLPHIEEHANYIRQCLNTFDGLVYPYYNRLNLQQQYNSLMINNYNLQEVSL